MILPLILLFAGLVAGFAAAWFIQKFRFAPDTIMLLEKERQLAAQKEEMESVSKRFSTEFENLANRIFEERSTKFSEQNKNSLEQILSPLNTRIKEFSETINKNFLDENRERGVFKAELTRLHELNKRLSDEAANLANALKGESKTIGDWGENVLETILESSGLQKGIHFFAQKSHLSENGETLRPDIQVNMPDNRHIIVDSKAPLSNYQKYYASESPEEKKQLLKRHADSIRLHMEALSKKEYDNLPTLNNPDFVFMFIPLEPAYTLAMQYDPELFNEALRKRVVIVSSASLMASLKIISTMWRYENQNRNIADIVKQAGLLYDKFVLFTDSIQEIGKHIDNTKDSYETAYKRLTAGSGNLVVSAQKIIRLGAKSSKNIDQTLLNASDDND